MERESPLNLNESTIPDMAKWRKEKESIPEIGPEVSLPSAPEDPISPRLTTPVRRLESLFWRIAQRAESSHAKMEAARRLNEKIESKEGMARAVLLIEQFIRRQARKTYQLLIRAIIRNYRKAGGAFIKRRAGE